MEWCCWRVACSIGLVPVEVKLLSESKTFRTLVTAAGQPLRSLYTAETERGSERIREDQNYVPVIVKRTDQAKVHPDDILERAIRDGYEQLYRPWLSLLLSSLAAGLILGFSVMVVAIVATAVESVPPLVERLLMALVYPFGFILCIMSGTQLFTEHTATAVYPVLDKRAPILRLGRLWLIVISGNLLGTLVSSWLLVAAKDVTIAHDGYLELVAHLTHYSTGSLFVSAVLAGWLMAQGAWVVLSTPPQSSQIISIYIATFLIGAGGLHHSIAGSAEMFVGVLISPEYSVNDALGFLSVALSGNMVGGTVFVALLNYGHIRKTQQKAQRQK